MGKSEKNIILHEEDAKRCKTDAPKQAMLSIRCIQEQFLGLLVAHCTKVLHCQSWTDGNESHISLMFRSVIPLSTRNYLILSHSEQSTSSSQEMSTEVNGGQQMSTIPKQYQTILKGRKHTLAKQPRDGRLREGLAMGRRRSERGERAQVLRYMDHPIIHCVVQYWLVLYHRKYRKSGMIVRGMRDDYHRLS